MSGTISHLNNSVDNIENSESLKHFADAKSQMKEIYENLEKSVANLLQLYSDGKKFIPDKEIAEVQRFQESITTIQKMLNRDKIKVVFFGRTNNGKSTVINAMLHQKLLPQSIGHTTNCIIEIEGGSNSEPMLQVEGNNEMLPITELSRLATPKNDSKIIEPNSVITVFYPKANSKLLQNDVILVDSPGIGLSLEADNWIDKNCLDADVFVLVCNSEATLTQVEMNFFLRVSKKLSRPNVFILNNRWDASSSEEEAKIEPVRIQHMKGFTEFLVDQLKCCGPQECKDRVFFISAREVLEQRMKERGELTNAYQQDGHARRRADFVNFETNFERLISKAAIRTKFEAHDRRAREIISDMKDNLDNVTNLASQEKQRLKLDYELKNREFHECRKRFAEFEQQYREQQKRIREEVHLKVSADFQVEVDHLEAIIDRYNEPGEFSDNPAKIDLYKQQLARYVDKCVTEDLEDKCCKVLMSRIWKLEQELYENVKNIIGVEYAKRLEEAWKFKRPFQLTINVNVPQLVNYFEEDLEVHSCFRSLLRQIMIIFGCLSKANNVATNEERLKNQMCGYLEQRMQQRGTIIAAQCENEVLAELQKIQSCFQKIVGDVQQQMETNLDKTKKSMAQIEGFLKEIDSIKNNSDSPTKKLDNFTAKFRRKQACDSS